MLAGGRGSGRGHGPGRVRGEEGKQAEAVLRRKPGPVQLRIDHYMVAVRPNGHQGAGAGAGPGDGSPVRFTGEANSRPGECEAHRGGSLLQIAGLMTSRNRHGLT